ncbi:MAG: hybrid sensor histidine kinase/response regulator [Minisyncoccota bacterium]
MSLRMRSTFPTKFPADILRDFFMSNSFTYALKIFAVAIIYFATSKMGLSFYAFSGFVTLIWPPTGIALAVLLLYGFELWPGIALGTFVANFLISGSIPIAMGIAAANTIESIVGVYVLRRFINFDYSLEHLRDSLGFIFVALTVPVISATGGIITLLVAGVLTADMVGPAWVTWWVGDVLGALTVTPFLVCWLARPFFWKGMSARMVSEWVLLFSFLIAVDVMVFLTPYTQFGPFSTIYLVVVPFMWAAIRTGPPGITLSVFITSIIGSWAAFLGHGIFSQPEVLTRVLSTEAFLAFITLIFLPFTSVVAEEKNVATILRHNIKRLHEALQKISSEDNAKNEFLAILAHELRNPLAPVTTSLELLNIKVGELDRPDILKIVSTAESHMRTIARLLDDLLDISRISRKKFRIQKETVELQSIIHHARETVEAFYASRTIELAVSVPKELLWISADAVRVEQILNNILYNAAKYTQAGGHVKLSATYDKENQEVVIVIQDDGIGIAPDMLKKIFEPFVQQNNASGSRVSAGLGIGLALTKRLVELHGGSVQAESAGLGQGSEFKVTLPAPNDIQLQPEFPLKERRRVGRTPYFTFIPSTVKEQGPTVLVVDDNKDAADGLKMLLDHSGYKTNVAYSGKEACEVAVTFRPRIAILDIGLPDMSGYELAGILRKELGDAAVLVALTGYGQTKDKMEAKKAGFNHHMTKPIGINDLKSILAQAKE